MRHADRWEADDRAILAKYATGVLTADDYESPDADEPRKPYTKPRAWRDEESFVSGLCARNPHM